LPFDALSLLSGFNLASQAEGEVIEVTERRFPDKPLIPMAI